MPDGTPVGPHLQALKVLFLDTLSRKTLPFERFCTIMPVPTDDVDMGWLARAPEMMEYLDELVISTVRGVDYTFKTKRYGRGLAFDRNEFDYSREGACRMKVIEFANRAKKHMFKQAIGVINDGETAIGYDGKALFADDHPDGKGGSNDNLLTGNGIDTYAHIATDWVASKTAMRGFIVDAAGADDTEKIDVAPNAVLCPPGAEDKLIAFFTANTTDGTNPNPYKDQVKKENIFVTSELSDANDWFPMYIPEQGEEGYTPLIVCQNREIQVNTFDETSEYFQLHEQYLFKVMAEYVAKPMYWPFIIKVKNT